jgi:hypothetical protein
MWLEAPEEDNDKKTGYMKRTTLSGKRADLRRNSVGHS